MITKSQKITNNIQPIYFAEVIESSLEQFSAQSWQWDKFPNFGSLVQVTGQEYTVFGCVISIQTGSSDPMRYPFPYQKTEEELRLEQPQIFEFLRTIFKVQILGYQNLPQNTKQSTTSMPAQNSQLFQSNLPNQFLYLLPPKPCKIHAFVQECPMQACLDFFENPEFLHLLFAFQNQTGNLDELLLAILHQLAKQNKLTNDALNKFCQTFSLLSGNDYRRLKLFLKRVEWIIQA